jgi:hypothetical protein
MAMLYATKAHAATVCPIGDCATPPSGITGAQQTAMLNLAQALLNNGFALAAQSNACTANLPVVPFGTANPLPDGEHVCFFQAQLAAMNALLCAELQRVATNTPGQFPPVPIAPAFTALTSAGVLTNAQLQAANATLQNLANAIGSARAIESNFPPSPLTPSAAQPANIARFMQRLGFTSAVAPSLANFTFQLYPPTPLAPPSVLASLTPNVAFFPPQPVSAANVSALQGFVLTNGAPPSPCFDILQAMSADSISVALIAAAWSSPVLSTITAAANPFVLVNDATVLTAFSALRDSTLAPFAAFTARPSAETSEFEATGSLTLTLGSTISPQTQDVSIQLGTSFATIPVGAFRAGSGGTLTYEGRISGTKVEASITPSVTGATFKLETEGVGTATSPLGVPVVLVIGDKLGVKSFSKGREPAPTPFGTQHFPSQGA